MRVFPRVHRDEQGATLILALAFMLMIGGIGAAVVSSVTSGLNDRAVLDQVRNRQYAADAGVERAIAAVRALPLPGYSPCPGSTSSLDGIDIRVDCANKLSTVATADGTFPQFNVVFTACEVNGSAPCGGPTTPIVIRAQVNYEGQADGGVPGVPKLKVTKTWVQSWSVNG
jgi:hypothetical protein